MSVKWAAFKASNALWRFVILFSFLGNQQFLPLGLDIQRSNQLALSSIKENSDGETCDRAPTSRICFFCGSLTLPARQQWEIAL